MLHADASERSASFAAADRELHFLLIAGPSGAGKSTFIRHLREGRLDPAIQRELPDNCARWPLIETNDMLKEGLGVSEILGRVGEAATGAILHYDIAFIHRFSLQGYDSDPACGLFQTARRLDTVFVKIDGNRLARQHSEREQARQRGKSRADVLWGEWVRRPLRQALYRLRGYPAVDTRALYLRPDFLSTCYAAWDVFTRQLMLARPNGKRISVVPVEDDDGAPSFELAPPDGDVATPGREI